VGVLRCAAVGCGCVVNVGLVLVAILDGGPLAGLAGARVAQLRVGLPLVLNALGCFSCSFAVALCYGFLSVWVFCQKSEEKKSEKTEKSINSY